MPTRYLSAALLALVGLSGALSAQARTLRPSEERDDARRRMRTVISTFGVDPDRPRLGISAESRGASDTLGVLVADVTEGGPAEKAGVKDGDRLLSINGVDLRLSAADANDEEMQGVTVRRLTRELSRHKAGDEVELRLMRDGRTQTVKVKTAPASDLASNMTWVGATRESSNRAALGVGLGGSPSKRDTLGILIASLTNDGPAEKAGLEEGDRIASINGVDLRVPREDIEDWAANSSRARRLNRELEKVKAGDEVELRVYRAGQPRTVKVKTVASRELERSRRTGFFIGDSEGMRGFGYSVPPTPPVPPMPPMSPMAPTPPTPPLPPLPPDEFQDSGRSRVFYFDGGDEGRVRLRMSPEMRDDMREEILQRSRDAAGRALQLMPRLRTRVRVEMDGLDEITNATPERSSSKPAVARIS